MEETHCAKRAKVHENLSTDTHLESSQKCTSNSNQNKQEQKPEEGNDTESKSPHVPNTSYRNDDFREYVEEEDLPDELQDRNYLPQGERLANLPTPYGFKEFDDLLLRFMKENNIPGLSIVISQKGKFIYTQCYGYATRGVLLGPDHMFRIASISKILTAVGTLHLYEGGHLKLTDRVFGPKGILPEFSPSTRGDRRLLKITVRHLLQHSAGWDREVVGDPVFWRHVGADTGVPEPVPNDVLIGYMMGQRLQFTPGSKYVYSNLGYVVLGRVIERVSGQRYEAYIQGILSEAGVTNVRLGRTFREQAHPDEVEYFASPPYRSVPSLFPGVGRVRAPYGAYSMETGQADGGWIATPRDLVRIAHSLEGVGDRRILKPETFKLMLERPPYARGTSCWYGLGLDVSWTRRAWEHGGHVDGATGCLTRSREGFTWAVLANYWPPDSDYTSLVSYGLLGVAALTKFSRGSVKGVDFASRDSRFAVNVRLEGGEFWGVKDVMTSKGYRVLWFDGYRMKERTYFNVIWIKDGVSGACFHALSSEDFTDTVQAQITSGFEPIHVNSYQSSECSVEGSNLRFCVIFTKYSDTPTSIIDHRLPLSLLDDKIKEYIINNYAIKCQSIYFEQGQPFVAAIFRKTENPSQAQWPRHGLSVDQYEKEFQRQSCYGHLPVYLKCYPDGDSEVKFSCIWEQSGAFLYTAEHDMSQYRVLNDLNIVERNKFHPSCLCGYAFEGTHKFAVVCVKEVKSAK